LNIFQVLSQGKSRLHEPSMSAMLGYLLDSGGDHGLGDIFIRKFIEALDEPLLRPLLNRKTILASVSLEEPHDLKGATKFIDVEVVIYDDQPHKDNQRRELHRLIIENKIRPGAAQAQQLNDYYHAVLEDDRKLPNLHMVFLTPESGSKGLAEEYGNLDVTEREGHSKHWLVWSSTKQSSINGIIKTILTEEAVGAINPINEYIRHTLKAFAVHSRSFVRAGSASSAGSDLGKIARDEEFHLSDGSRYRALMRDSGQIQIINLETEDKEPARPILSRFIDEEPTLDIPHRSLATRQIGKRLFDWWEAKKR